VSLREHRPLFSLLHSLTIFTYLMIFGGFLGINSNLHYIYALVWLIIYAKFILRYPSGVLCNIIKNLKDSTICYDPCREIWPYVEKKFKQNVELSEK
jgi:hypothetical protein